MTRKDFALLKWSMVDAVVLDTDLRRSDLRVALLLISTYLNFDSLTAYPAAKTMADILGIEVRTVRRAINRLTAPDGWFKIVRHGGSGRSNRYTPNWERIERVTPESPFRGQQQSERVTQESEKGDMPVPKTVTCKSSEPLKEPFEKPYARAARFATPDGDARGATCKTKKICSAWTEERRKSVIYQRTQELESGGRIKLATLSDFEREAADEWLSEPGENDDKQPPVESNGDDVTAPNGAPGGKCFEVEDDPEERAAIQDFDG